MAAGLYTKKHGSIDSTAQCRSSIVRCRTENQQRLNDHNKYRSSLPAELRTMELNRLGCVYDTQLPGSQNFRQEGLKPTVAYPRKSVCFDKPDQTALPDPNSSWWYVLCLQCRKKEVGPGWEPNYWSKGCPYPFCPSYRHVARVLALLITGLLLWGIVYTIIGAEAKPGGQLFNIAVLVITAYMGGWVFRMLTLPALIGMLLVGMVFQNFGLIHIQGSYSTLVSTLRKIALVVILTRAGLDLDSKVLKKLYFRVLILALIPWIVEAAVIALATNYLLDLPWQWAVLCGSIIAAVAPAVVVPCLFRLRTKGYGVAKGIPTLIIAVAGIDDAASVVAFGVASSMLIGTNTVTYNLMVSPISIVVGIVYGMLWGFIVKYIPERSDPYVVPLRILMLSGGGILAVLGCEETSLEGAGPLAVISAAFTSIYFWTKQGWDIEDNAVATAFEIFWMVFEPVLFGLTGTQIVLNDLDYSIVSIGAACVAVAFVVRICVTILVATGSSLNFKEKLFVALSWMAKASVQAALGPAVLEAARQDGEPQNMVYARTIVMVCIISILLTAPAGALIISLTGSRLLTKAKHTAPNGDQWRPGPRRSIRDITIIDDDDDDDDKCKVTAEDDPPPPSPPEAGEKAFENERVPDESVIEKV